MDLSRLSTEDLLALKGGDLSKVSTEGLLALKGGPATPPAQTYGEAVAGTGKNMLLAARDLAAGAVRGAGSIGATLLAPVDAAARAIGVQNDYVGRTDRREAMTGALGSMGADTGSMAFGAGKLGAEVAGTLGVGGVLALGATAVPGVASGLPGVVNAIRSAGMQTGAAGGALAQGLTRIAGGGIAGAGAAALVNPSDALTGGVVGAATPGALQLAAKFGGKVYAAVRSGAPGAGKLLAEAMGVTEAELPGIIAALKSAPAEVVPGSRLTVAQALQTQSANTPGAKMLERVVSGGPGGDRLLKRYADQGEARMAALQAQGARTYQGAAREEATLTGDKIGAVLRTQATDDRGAAREAWEGLYGQAAQDGVALQIPLDEMAAAMKPLGPGTVGAGKDAAAVLRTATEIGADVVPDAVATTQRVGASANDKTLGQAVRAIGIHPDELKAGSGAMGGEVRWLRESLKGGRGLVNKNGQRLERIAERMYEDGYLAAPNMDELLEKLAMEAQGSPVFSMSASPGRLAYMAQGGDIPARPGSIIPKAVPFEEFQRLRRSAGEIAAKVGERGSRTEAGVLNELQRIMERRVDDAASGNLLPDELMPAGFRERYNMARDMTRRNAERYDQSNNIGAILRKPVGQDYRLTGDEITNKLWHGGSGLAGDVNALRGIVSDANREPVMDALGRFIMTDAASKTTASGQFGSALPRYVETRMPGLQEALKPDQLEALANVAADIRNAEAAASVPGLRGSDTHAKISRALDAGLLDAPMAKAAARFLSFRGVGLEPLRNKLAELSVQSKGATMAGLLSNPQEAASALEYLRRAPEVNALAALLGPSPLVQFGYRAAPLFAGDR